MASDSSPPSYVRDWLATPAPFNVYKHGRRAIFSGDDSVVERREAERYLEDCVVYTREPLPLGHVWQTTVLNTTWRRWGLGLTVGVTSALPESVPSALFAGVSTNKWLYDCSRLSSGGTVGLLMTTSGDLYEYWNGRSGGRVATGLPVNQHIWGMASVQFNCSEIKSEMLSASPQYILQAALRDGFIPHIDDKFLIHGAGGVGKSSVIDMFLGKQRDLIRNSTPVAKEPIHLQLVRDISNQRLTANWESVDYVRLSGMVAHTSNKIYEGKVNVDQKEREKESGDGSEEGKEKREGIQSSTASSASAQLVTPLSTPAHKSVPKREFNNVASRFFFKLGQVFQGSQKSRQLQPASISTSLEVDPDNLSQLFSDFLDGLHNKVMSSKEVGELLMSHSIRLIDSGGQPQFLELVSIFLSHISGFISVFKLSEPLSGHGKVAFYKQGEATNEPYESHYSHEQVIRHDLQVIQSEAARSGIEEMPNLAFVGTFLDQQDTCPEETPDKKDERLHSIITEMLPEEMQECVITSGGSLKQATFRVNARTPGPHDFESVGRLKGALMSRSRSKSRDLPLKWHGYEVALHMLMNELRRQSLRRNECEFIGYKLGFDLASLNAALDYLRKLNIISFYDVLPDVIFGSSQVILDKITELVRYSLELKKGKYIAGGAERKFVQQGIISLEFLKSPALSKHYISELFQPEDLLKVFISLLVVSAVGNGEYIVPSVLEVSSIYPSPPTPAGSLHSSFILQFLKKSPMFGVYCCTISSLLSNAGWKLLIEDGEVVQVARNSISFKVPGDLPGKVTFLDPLSSYLEVAVELPARVAAKHKKTLYPKIRNSFMAAVEKAMETLHYEVCLPEVSFMCPEQSGQCSTMPHPATVMDEQSFLVCSLKPSSVCHSITEEQQIWLSKDSKPLGSSWFRRRKKPFKKSAPPAVAVPDTQVGSRPVQRAPVHPLANTAVGQSLAHHPSTETYDLASHKSQISSSSGVAQSGSENPPQTDHYSSVQAQRTGDGPPPDPHISLPAQQREYGPLQYKTSQPVTYLSDQSSQTQEREDGAPSCRPAHGSHSSLQTQQEEGDPLRLKPTVQLTSPSGDTTSLQGRSDLLRDPSVHRTQQVASPSKLADEVSDKDLATIARDHLSNWESLRPYLELSHAQKEEIRRSCPGDYGKQKQECLEVWKQTKRNEATYHALITAAEDAMQQNLADGVRSLLTSRQNIPPPDMKGEHECAGLATHEQHQDTRNNAHAGLTSLNNDHIESSSDTDGQSSQLNSLQVQGGEETPLQHKPPTQLTKPVASASGEHGSLQVHEDRVDPSSDYHLPQTSQEQTSHSSEATRLQVHEDRDEPRKKPPREKTTFTDSTPPSTDQPPSLPKLFRLKIHQEVAPHFKIFGTFLLNDETGSRVDSIKRACLGDPKDIVVSILEEWIAGRGKPLTWGTLIKTLRDCDLNPLADEVEDFVTKL